MPNTDFSTLLCLLKAKWVVMFAAYFDESGTDAGSAFTSVAGYVFEADQYTRFETEWSDVLAAFGVQTFHMADCAHGRGEFQKLTKPERIDLATRCIGIIKRRTRIGVVVSVARTDFLAVTNINVVNDPYVLCLLWCLGGISAWVAHLQIREKVAYFFEAGHALQSRANNAMGLLHQRERPRLYDAYHSHSFIRKNDASGLHAADLLAWEWRAELQNMFGPKRRTRRLSLASLAAAPHIYCHFSADHLDAIHVQAMQGDALRFHDLLPERSLTVITKERADASSMG
jgi:hypothetical protein